MQRWPPGSSTSAKGDETYQAPLSSTVYIEQTDFREDGQVKDFYGLAPGREVLLRCMSGSEIDGAPVLLLAWQQSAGGGEGSWDGTWRVG